MADLLSREKSLRDRNTQMLVPGKDFGSVLKLLADQVSHFLIHDGWYSVSCVQYNFLPQGQVVWQEFALYVSLRIAWDKLIKSSCACRP